jgi:phosphotransferase system IIB component
MSFRVKTVIFGQTRVHRVNTGQNMSTRVKNEFQAVSGQNHHFRSKPSPPSQYGSNHVDQGKKWVLGRFRVKTVISGQNRVHQVNTGQTMSTRVKNKFQVILGQNCYFRSLKLIFSGWIGFFLILNWVFNFTYINIYYYT